MFKEKLFISITFLEKKKVLDVLDTATHFSFKVFLEAQKAELGKSIDSGKDAFVKNWRLILIKRPKIHCAD